MNVRFDDFCSRGDVPKDESLNVVGKLLRIVTIGFAVSRIPDVQK